MPSNKLCLLFVLLLSALIASCGGGGSGGSSGGGPKTCPDEISNSELSWFQNQLEEASLTKSDLCKKTSIDLSNKGIASIPQGAFRGLSKLKDLQLGLGLLNLRCTDQNKTLWGIPSTVSNYQCESRLFNVTNISDNGSLNLNGANGIATTVLGNSTYLFVTGYSDDGISVFEIESDGTLSNVENVLDGHSSKS